MLVGEPFLIVSFLLKGKFANAYLYRYLTA
jgi:hypothetical protein